MAIVYGRRQRAAVMMSTAQARKRKRLFPIVFTFFLILALLLVGRHDHDGDKTNDSQQHVATAARDESSSLSLLPPWQEGCLDIHHLNLGNSVSTFAVFPDGTTLLIDAGDIVEQGGTDNRNGSLTLPRNQTAAQGVLQYLQHAWPYPKRREIDYFLLTHFGAHQEENATARPLSKSGNFRQVGILATLVEHVKIHRVLDRNFPTYDFPVNLQEWGNADMTNYLALVQEYQSDGKIQWERLKVGNASQIQMLHCATEPPKNQRACLERFPFRVRNLRANLNVSKATAEDSSVQTIPGGENLVSTDNDGDNGQIQSWNENKLSVGIVVEYGDFRYYEGANQDHRDVEGSPGIDTVTPTAQAAGRVDVATLNHHGKGVNRALVEHLDPRIWIQQGCRSQLNDETLEQLGDMSTSRRDRRDIYSTLTSPEEEILDRIASTEGHTVVRVYEPQKDGSEQQYAVFVLNQEYKVVKNQTYLVLN